MVYANQRFLRIKTFFKKSLNILGEGEVGVHNNRHPPPPCNTHGRKEVFSPKYLFPKLPENSDCCLLCQNQSPACSLSPRKSQAGAWVSCLDWRYLPGQEMKDGQSGSLSGDGRGCGRQAATLPVLLCRRAGCQGSRSLGGGRSAENSWWGLSGTAWLELAQLFFSHTKTIASGHWLGTEAGRVNNFNAKSTALLSRV